MSNFSTEVKIPINWGDMDAFGHVNNVIYLRYFETSRVKYFDRMPNMQNFPGIAKPVLVSVSCEYKKPVVYPDELTVKVGVTKLGNASMTMACEMYSSKGYLAFTGECVLVMVDLEKQRPSRISAELRAFIEEIEGKTSWE